MAIRIRHGNILTSRVSKSQGHCESRVWTIIIEKERTWRWLERILQLCRCEYMLVGVGNDRIRVWNA